MLSKPKELFLPELYSFMESINQPITKTPSLGYQELDLHRLFHAVVSRGGMDEVTRRQEWKLVYQELEIPTMSTSASYNTRTNYKKYLYLYELEVCDWGEERPEDAPGPLFQVGEYVRIVSSTFEGQVFYAQISKYRYRNNSNSYYVHYNGWSTSHDEWMPEHVLEALRPEEKGTPADLANPSPTRSSKSNYIIYDPLISERHQQRMAAVVTGQSSGPATPKSAKRKRSSPGRKDDSVAGGDSEDLDRDEDFVISRMATASQQTSPMINGAAARQSSRRRHERPAKSSNRRGKPTFFLEEMEHPACDDRIHGYPKHRRDSAPVLDFGLGEPEQLFYFGGQWKHTTPRVRKFHIHGTVLAASALLDIGEEMLRAAMQPQRIVVPQLPTLKLPRMPPVPKALAAPAVETSADRRSAVELQVVIEEKEAMLRVLKKDLKHKSRLLQRYYGRQAGKPSTASALLSSSFKVSRR